MELDLHGRQRGDAYIEICRALDECIIVGDDRLDLIHGFHHGVSLQSFVRSNKFLSKLKKAKYKVEILDTTDPGVTRFKIVK